MKTVLRILVVCFGLLNAKPLYRMARHLLGGLPLGAPGVLVYAPIAALVAAYIASAAAGEEAALRFSSSSNATTSRLRSSI